MFVPPYQLILELLRSAASGPRKADDVTVPKAVLDLMLRLLVEKMSFDETQYLRRNGDVSTAMQQAKINDAHEHFTREGYFEGRVGGSPVVDEAWYQRRYPDVAKAIGGGALTSASDHYVTSGAKEWRAPSARDEVLISEWQRALAASAAKPASSPVRLPEAHLDPRRRSQ
jgi:hypothetical protein